ncbi:MAG: flagellar protein FlbA, partial [Sulfuricella denitrificans]|nr:flagellar protein FlbA [Sulfuricella denitrificans]
IHIPPGIDLKDELDEAAALTAALDLVITAGTSVAATSGALGQKTWMYSLDTVWDRLGAEHYPWMPSIHMYLKKWDAPWEPLLDQIGQDLESWAGEERKA